MATLPDIDTSKVGVIGFWNAEDNGTGEVDPTEVLSYSEVASYKQYDNGVEGTLDTTVTYGGVISADNFNHQLKFRVKTDGWFVVYTDRTNEWGNTIWCTEGSFSRDFAVNYHNILSEPTGYDWSTDRDATPPTLPTTALSLHMNNMLQELSNTASFTFNHADVGYYSYTQDTATNMTSVYDQIGDGSGAGGISRTSGTDILFHSCGMAAYENDAVTIKGTFAGVTVYDTSTANVDNNAYSVVGIVDMKAANAMSSAGTTYDNYMQGYNKYRNATHLIMWE